MAGFVNAGCDKAMFGWPCDAEIEKLRDQFARETDPAKQKEIAAAVQMRNTEVTTHLFLGQWYLPAACARTSREFRPRRCRCSGTSRRRASPDAGVLRLMTEPASHATPAMH